MKDLTPKKIKAELDNVHSISAPAFAVYNWVNEFKHGHTFTCDEPRSGYSIEAATSKIIDKVYDIVLIDRRVKVRELEATGISHGTMISILHEQLGMKKLSARWVPHLLTVDHKRDRVTISKHVWRCFNVIQMNFCVDSLLWTRHGSIASHPRRRNSQNNELHWVN